MSTGHHQVVIEYRQARDSICVAHNCLNHFVRRWVNKAQLIVFSASYQHAGTRNYLVDLGGTQEGFLREAVSNLGVSYLLGHLDLLNLLAGFAIIKHDTGLCVTDCEVGLIRQPTSGGGRQEVT